MSKILFITSLFPSVKEQSFGSFVLNQIELIGRNNDVKVIIEVRFEISKKSFFKLLFTKPAQLFTHRIDHDYQHANLNIVALQYPIFTFYIADRIQFFLIKKSFLRLAKDIIISQNWRPDIIHAHYLFNSGIFAYLIGERYGLPFVVSEHNPVSFNTDFWALKAREAYLKSSLYFVVSHHEYRRFLTYNTGKRPFILNNYADGNRFTVKSENPQIFTVLFVGYPHELKGMKILFEIIINLKKNKTSDIVFKIVSPDIETLEFPAGLSNYILENDLTGYCELLSRRTLKEMPELYQGSDVLLSTSINETFGLSILEALMCGIPVVSTRSGGPEDFLNERNSLLFQIDDVNGMAEAIIKLKNKSISFNKQTVRSTVVNTFSEIYFLQKLTTFYNKILANETTGV
jgi:glycosyltransferase involved in cell wall biosynthesis